MKTAAILSLLAASASAFAPAPVSKSSTSLAGSVFDDYVGAKDFRGAEMKFDPLNLSETYEPFQAWFRECELRHGRTAMLAVVGFWATDFVRIPGEMYSFEAIPKTIDAHDALLKTGPMYQLALWIGLFDLIVTAPACQALGEGEREAGGEYLMIKNCCASLGHTFVSLYFFNYANFKHSFNRLWMEVVCSIWKGGFRQEA